jgi:hypothetical protein
LEAGSLTGAGAAEGLSRSIGNAARSWFRDARGRVLLVIVGDLVIMHRSGLAGPKAVYLLLVALAAAAAIPAVREVFRDPARRDDRQLVIAAAAIGILAVLSLPVALARDNAPTDWLRDVAVYGLVAVAPALAIDLRRSAGIRWVTWALIAAGAVGTVSFSANWVMLRGYANLPFDRAGILLPSFYLAAGLMALASGRAIVTTGRERALWALTAVVVFGAMVGSGTRTSAILLAAPLVQLAFSRHRRPLTIAIAVLVVLAVVLAIAANRNINLGVVGNRLASAITFVRHPGADASWQEREAVTRDAITAWRHSPILGVGPGHIFYLHGGIRDGEPAGFQIDTATGYLAKFGLVGIPVLVAFLLTVAAVVRSRVRAGQLDAALPLIGLMAVALCGFAFSVPLEDKGFPIAFLLSYALLLPGRANPPLAAPERRRLALCLTAAVAVGCAIAAAASGRFVPPDTASISGTMTPALRTVATYEHALWAGDGAQACRLLAPSARAAYGSVTRCDVVLSSAAHGDPSFAGSRADDAVAVAGSHGRTVRIVVHRRNSAIANYLVTRNGAGDWLVLSLRAIPAAPDS